MAGHHLVYLSITTGCLNVLPGCRNFVLAVCMPSSSHLVAAGGPALSGQCVVERLAAEAQRRAAVFLTTDRDFFHTIPHLHEKHAGIIVIALRQPNRSAILEKLSWVLKRLQSDAFRDRAIQLRDQSWIAIPPLEPLGCPPAAHQHQGRHL